jgi:AAA domain
VRVLPGPRGLPGPDGAIRTFLKAISGVPSYSTEQLSVFHSYDQMKNAPPVRFVINGFLQAEGVTILGGASGHDKTWVAAATTKALLTGEPLFDYFQVVERAVKVIYRAPEISLGQAFYRLRSKFKLDEYIERGSC